ncbi:unnamed protein product [Arctogadus glacialis]
MAASVGLAMNPPHTEERAVFTQLKPVRMTAGECTEDSSVFEEVKPACGGLGPGGRWVGVMQPGPGEAETGPRGRQ